MKTASVFGVLGVLLSAVVACTTEVAGTNASDGGTNATLNPACSLLATCCDRWPADVRRSCTGPVEANGDGCRALLSNNAAVAAYCPELSVESCSEDLKKVLPEQCGGPGGGVPTGLTSFRASNVGALSAPDGVVDITLPNDYRECTIDTATGTSSCITGGAKLIAKRMADYDVLFAKSISIPPKVQFKLTGQRPAILVVTESIDVQGTLSVGYVGDILDPSGQRPGSLVTGPGVGSGYYGGGGYCGVGGLGYKGAGKQGTTYGNASLVPLVGGSHGGDSSRGAGGGALQIVAGKTVTVNGVLLANGQDGDDGGGGSGGALLVEAPSIEGTGVLVAIGGRGADDANAGSGGGAGGGQDGTAAGKDAAQAYSGGGGGAGRIRLNARTQNFKGKLMPNESSTCASKGTLADP
ncbi:MAG: hypothetical protein U0174_16585 [Polyangiaceae bacterium]